MTDKERLDFLLTYFVIEDVGDENNIAGVNVMYDDLEEDLTWSKNFNGRRNHLVSFGDDLRDVIDRAIESHAK